MKRTKYGFTLIELLIVVAIIAILAAIAVPNFLEAQTRAKVARVNSDQRSLATAIESYAVDLNTYPVSAYATAPFKGAGPMTFKAYASITTPIAYITTIPLDVFAVRLGADMCGGWAAGNKNPFLYWSGSSNGTDLSDMSMRRAFWLLESVGPDMLADIAVSSLTFWSTTKTPNGDDWVTPAAVVPYTIDPFDPILGAQVMLKGGTDSTLGTGGAWSGVTYDASNGTNSRGDIYKFNSGAALPMFLIGRK